MIEIDGSFGEGGGQIVRTSVALSAVTGRPVRITKIRQGRPKPGLAPQHARAIQALADICSAKTSGAAPGSSEVTFSPGEIRGGDYEIAIGTAGSATLLIQCLLPALLHAKSSSTLRVIGGTDVKWSPTIDYLRNVFLSALYCFGAEVSLELEQRGYYPRGEGRVLCQIEPSRLKAAHLDLLGPADSDGWTRERESVRDMLKEEGRGADQHAGQYTGGHAGQHIKAEQEMGIGWETEDGQGINREPQMETGQNLERKKPMGIVLGVSHSSNLPEHVAWRQAEAAAGILQGAGYEVEIVQETLRLPSMGSGITLWSRYNGAYLGSSSLGERGLPAEKVGKRAAEELLPELASGAGVDVHLADQLVPYLALAGGSYTTREVSAHARTNIWTAGHFLERRISILEGDVKKLQA